MALHVAVIGAGAFGGWTALHLRRAGARVTLIDAWGAGNSRASSGGETRIIRLMYGGQARYVELTLRAFELWWEHEQRWHRKLYRRTGVLWLFEGDDAYARTTVPLVTDPRFPVEQWPAEAVTARYPCIATDGVRTAYYEQEAGYLLARLACEQVRQAVLHEGGEWRLAAVQPGPIAGGALQDVALSDGTTLRADYYVFACGPWLGRLFPDVIGARIQATRQEVIFFGTPPGDRAHDEDALPIWLNVGERTLYGIPGNERRGFKIADDTRGEPVDPTSLERIVSTAAVERARALLARRFPALSAAPILETRVCQYEQSRDQHFVLDRHPLAHNVWLAGGGSGHGFKMGPAVGELMAHLVLGHREPEALFRLGRFDT
jgi:glycine/D-amino acid oxidase-like deaminating enzyme